MSAPRLHKVQVSILRSLRRNEAVRFSDLMRPTGLQSDVFKFHIRNLSAMEYIDKTLAGSYQLTAKGKEFANNLDETKRIAQKQPKLSVLIVAARQNEQGQAVYLFQKRLRNPFYGYWGLTGGPVQWGEDIEETAAKELKKQTNLTATFAVSSFYRERDFDRDSKTLLEDKLFVIVDATNVSGELTNSWSGGLNQWMTINELNQQPTYFKQSHHVIESSQAKQLYTSNVVGYGTKEY